MIIGQAPGVREPTLKRPFAHTAGKTLFRWFEQFCGVNEATMRARIYFAAVIRCFPGKAPGGSDRLPMFDEIRNCSGWMKAEFKILRPALVIPVGRLAITQLINCAKLEDVIGRSFVVTYEDLKFEVIPLPHPSGVSPWHKIPPGRELLIRAMKKIARHPKIRALSESRHPERSGGMASRQHELTYNAQKIGRHTPPRQHRSQAKKLS